jgi:hypothetical protein
MKTFLYRVSMLGFEEVEGELFANNPAEAAGQAVLLFEQTNDLDAVGTMAERVRFYAPKIKAKNER